MNSYRARRATLDDLPQLAEVWRSAHLPFEKLEKEFTDFQIAETLEGKLIAAIGLHIDASNGRVHSETYADFGLTDELRPALWERVQIVAQNHGLFRLWTQEPAPWWKKAAGFTLPSDGLLQKLPATFGVPDKSWLTLRLRDEGADPAQLDKEIAAFKETERLRLEKIIYRGRIIKATGTLIAVLLFVFAMGMLLYYVSHRR